MRRRAAPRIQSLTVPAPIGGTNSVAPVTALPASDCIFSYNMISGEGGLRTRPGWEPHSTELFGVSVPRTLIGYRGSAEDGTKDRLFSVTSAGIGNATGSTFQYNALALANPAGLAGLGVWASRTGVDGAKYIYYADEVNGLYLYRESTDTWAKMTLGGAAPLGIAGVDPANIAFVMVWKNRTWLVERGTSKAWYLDAGAISGTATAFDFGGQFRAGGSLVGLWSWTYDGGAGIDDALVGVSGAGDVVIYQGTDPASDVSIKGVWSVGAIPPGRRIATNFGGDVLILSFRGVIPLSQLVLSGAETAQYVTGKIQPLFNRYVQDYRTQQGWSIHLHPAENALVVLVPTLGLDGIKTPLVFSFATKGWFPWRNLSLYCCEAWRGDLYLGAQFGRIGINRGFRDFAVNSPDPEDPLFGEYNRPVAYGLLTGFSDMGRSNVKQVQFVQPTVLSETVAPNIEVRAIHGVNTTELQDSFVDSGVTASVGVWDTSLWDQAIWGGDIAVAQPFLGSQGIAREVALQVRGFATSRTTLVKFDVGFVEGGYL